MSSREIAELLDVRHADVKRTIERLMEREAIGGYAPVAYTHEQNGQQYNEYLIGKRDSYVIVAQLSPEFTAALEAVAKPALPTTYLEALRAHLASEEKVAMLALENAKKDKVIAEQAPKVD